MHNTISSAEISEHLGFKITIEFIETELGVAPYERIKRSAYYKEPQVLQIIDGLQARLDAVRAEPMKLVAKKTKPAAGSPVDPAAAFDEEEEL